MYEYVSLFTLALSTVLGEYISSWYLFNIKTILLDIFNIFFYQLLCHRASCCISRVAYSLDRWIFIICATSQHITCDNKITRSDTALHFCISGKYCHKRYCVCELINTDIKKYLDLPLVVCDRCFRGLQTSYDIFVGRVKGLRFLQKISSSDMFDTKTSC